jgi:hypothetical protein
VNCFRCVAFIRSVEDEGAGRPWNLDSGIRNGLLHFGVAEIFHDMFWWNIKMIYKSHRSEKTQEKQEAFSGNNQG